MCRGFTYKDKTRKPFRHYQSIMGALVRKNFPGIVDVEDGRKDVAWTFKHYKYAKDPTKEYPDLATRVIAHFWVSSFDFSSFGNFEVALMDLTFFTYVHGACSNTSPMSPMRRGKVYRCPRRCARS